MQFKNVKINLNLTIIDSIEGIWETNDVQRLSA